MFMTSWWRDDDDDDDVMTLMTLQDSQGVWLVAKERRQRHRVHSADRDAGYDERCRGLQKSGTFWFCNVCNGYFCQGGYLNFPAAKELSNKFTVNECIFFEANLQRRTTNGEINKTGVKSVSVFSGWTLWVQRRNEYLACKSYSINPRRSLAGTRSDLK